MFLSRTVRIVDAIPSYTQRKINRNATISTEVRWTTYIRRSLTFSKENQNFAKWQVIRTKNNMNRNVEAHWYIWYSQRTFRCGQSSEPRRASPGVRDIMAAISLSVLSHNFWVASESIKSGHSGFFRYISIATWTDSENSWNCKRRIFNFTLYKSWIQRWNYTTQFKDQEIKTIHAWKANGTFIFW